MRHLLEALTRITSSLSDIVFHKTGTNKALEILRSNRFLLTLAGESDSLHKELYFLSTTRSPVGDYDNNVTLKLDGRKLNNNHRGMPVDYWGRDWKKDEMEDRLVSDKPIIRDACKYVLEVHVQFIPEVNGPEVRKLAIEAKKKEIPVYIYEDENAYKTLNKNKAITDFSGLTGEREPRMTFHRRNLAYLPALFYKKSSSELDKDAARKLQSLIRYKKEFLTSLQADIHNNKPHDLTAVNELLLRSKTRSLQQLVDYLHTKWLAILDEEERVNEEKSFFEQTEDRLFFSASSSDMIEYLYGNSKLPEDVIGRLQNFIYFWDDKKTDLIKGWLSRHKESYLASWLEENEITVESMKKMAGARR